jgi:import inner membrane translocase subunit TIM50
VDLERTLIGSVYDSRYGWRHVKRPGLDKFIKDLSQYYEIVIHSENDVGAATEILMAIDPEGRTHKLGNAAAEMRGETILKRLDLMNRDMNKIILIDDNPESAQLFPRNTLFVEPFTNVENKSDTVLLELIPFLQALVHEDVQDYREAFDRLGTHQAEEAVVEYQMRLAKKKREEQEKRNRGIGSLIRGQKESTEDEFFVKSSVLSPKDIVGRSPDVPEVSASLGLKPKIAQNNEPKQPAAKKKGALFSYLDEVEKNKEEDEKRKREKWQEIQMARHFAKMKAEEESKNVQE